MLGQASLTLTTSLVLLFVGESTQRRIGGTHELRTPGKNYEAYLKALDFCPEGINPWLQSGQIVYSLKIEGDEISVLWKREGIVTNQRKVKFGEQFEEADICGRRRTVWYVKGEPDLLLTYYKYNDSDLRANLIWEFGRDDLKLYVDAYNENKEKNVVSSLTFKRISDDFQE